MNRILIAHEKHGKRYFDISTDRLFAEKSFNLLKERFNEHFYTPYTPKDLDKPFQEWPVEVVETMADDLKKIYTQSKRDYDNVHKMYEEELKFYNSIKLIIDNEDMMKYQKDMGGRYPISFRYLDARSDAEYEQVTIENVE